MFNSLPILLIAIFITILIGLVGIILYHVYMYITQTELHISSNKNITILDRCSSIFPYWLPLLEGLQNFGQQILPDYPFRLMSLYKQTLMPFVIFYVTHPALAFITFFVLYYLFVRAKSPIPDRPFIRFNVLQSILLFLINSLLVLK